MPTNPIGSEQYDYDSIKYMFQQRNPGDRPLVPPADTFTKKFKIDPPKKSEKSKGDKKHDRNRK